MRERTSRHELVKWGMRIVLAAFLSGCGNSEPPSIEDLSLSFEDPTDGTRKPLTVINGEQVAESSPVRLSGKITDNTAVVSPKVTIQGKRRDVEDVEFACPHGASGFDECLFSFTAADLVRGQTIVLREVDPADAETILQEVEVQVSEIEPYRILEIEETRQGEGDLARSLYLRNLTDGTISRLQAGDALPGADGGPEFSLWVETSSGRVFSGVWQRATLAKWDEAFALDLDPTSGSYNATFQLYDPSRAGRPLEEAPTYRFTISAYDAPDQKEDVGRYSEKSRVLTFWPPRGELVSGALREDVLPPEITLEGIDETTEPITVSSSTRLIGGQVRDNAGEVRWLRVRLSNGAPGSGGSGFREQILYFDPGLISLTGGFVLNLSFVSDWDENGVIDVLEAGKGVANYLQLTAQDINGNETSYPSSLQFDFVPPASSSSAPTLSLARTFPELDGNEEVSLPAGEVLRVRGTATDVSGQPIAQWWECPGCPSLPEEAWDTLNEELCPCSLKQTLPLNPSGQFPANPWDWIEVPAGDLTSGTVHILKAIKRVRTAGEIQNAPFAAREILHPEDPDASDPQLVAVQPSATVGPLVSLGSAPTPANGTILTADGLGDFVADFGTLAASIAPQVSQLNQIVARVIGGRILEESGRCKIPEFRGDTGAFDWDLGRVEVGEEDRVCVGAVSLAGHATLHLWEFEQVAEGLRVLLTISTDPEDCPQEPQVFPCPAGSE
ncbi:MAG: hypothetical protein AB1640_07695 [bacterium]